MDCSNCDRNNVVRSFCYFTRHPYEYEAATGELITIESFTVFATELELEWRIPVCSQVPRNELVFYWKLLEPFLVEALHKK